MTQKEERPAILEFEGVTFDAQHTRYESGLRGADFVLRAGELLVMRTSAGTSHVPVADLAVGIAAPDSGSVRFCGRDWLEVTPADAASARGRIGRVFDRHGWISNLDMDENITLPLRHHTVRAEEAIDREARELAERFGLPDLPRIRPAMMKRSDLRRCEWVRAFLGEPALILLEEPMRDVYAEHQASLIAEVRRACGRGAAVLWMTRDGQMGAVEGCSARRECRVEDEQLVWIE